MDAYICKLMSFGSKEFSYIISLTVAVPPFYLVSLSESPLDFRLPKLFIKFSCFFFSCLFFLLYFPSLSHFYVICQRFFSNVFSNSSIKFNFCIHIFISKSSFWYSECSFL